LDPIIREVNQLSNYPVDIIRSYAAYPDAVFSATSAHLSGHVSARRAMQNLAASQLRRDQSTDSDNRSAFIDRDSLGRAEAFVIRIPVPRADLAALPDIIRVLPGQDIPFVKLKDGPDIVSTAVLHGLDPEQTVAFGAIAHRLQQHINNVPTSEISQLLLGVLGNAGGFIVLLLYIHL
jgi:hypothetical protein